MTNYRLSINPTTKQAKAWLRILDKKTRFLLFGGGAGGGKSWFGCEWLIVMSLKYPGTKWFMGRNELKRLMGSTYITFQKVLRHHGIPLSIYRLNGQFNYIQFSNGSRIDLLDLKYNPSDPLFERFGSMEFTGGFIEEAGEVDFKAFDVLKSRIGRHLNKEYDLMPKILLTCNPKKNWLYMKFYKPSINNELPEGYYFIQSLYYDNPYTADEYGRSLSEISDMNQRERLMNGNWDYDDDPNLLFDYDAIMDMFSNYHVKKTGDKYISADLAMKGRDMFVVSVWDGLVCKFPIVKPHASGKQIEEDLKQISEKESVWNSNVVADSDGLGNYLESYMEGIKEFHGGSSAVDKEKYKNLRAECYFKLAELVNKRLIKIETDSEEIKNKIIEELSVIKAEEVENDEKKKKIMSKDDIKKILGRSPDFADTLMMRMFFEVKNEKYVILDASKSSFF